MDKFSNKWISYDLFKHFRWYDYLIVSAVLFVGSTIISLVYQYHASNQECAEKRRKHVRLTKHDDESTSDASTSFASHSNSIPENGDGKAIGGKWLSPIIVAFALFSSFTSGNLILKTTDQIFLYGTQSIVMLATFLVIGLSLGYFYLPVFYNLLLSSAFEYFQIRFSRTTRVVMSLLAILQSILLLVIVTYETANGFGLIVNPELNRIILCGLLLFIATFTCLIGNLKSLLCTNVLYVIVILGTLITVTVLGVLQLGGFETAWERSLNSSRIEFARIDPDLKNPDTLWTCLFGQYFLCTAFLMSTNSTAQRMISMKTLYHARISLLLLGFITILCVILCVMIGLLISAKYFDCDPDTSQGFVFPTFVVQTFSEFPGVYGLWLATVICATISVLSNVLHGLGMMLITDYVQYYFKDMGENLIHILLKIFIFKFGCIVFGIILFLDLYQEFAQMLNGIFLVLIGTVFGVFTLGMFFPWANSKGSLLGVLAPLSAMGVLIYGAQDFVLKGGQFPNYKLPVASSTCPPSDLIIRAPNLDNISHINHTEVLPTPFSQLSQTESQNDAIELEFDFANYVVQISQVWYPAIAFLITVLSGLLFSVLILRWTTKWRVAQECLSPPMLRFWVKLFPTHMQSWIEPEDDLLFLCSNAYPFTPKEGRRRKYDKSEPWCEIHIQPIH